MKINAGRFVLQRDHSDCGVACLATLIKLHEGDCTLEKLRELSGTSKQGTTLLGLMHAARESGFDAEGMQAESLANVNSLEHPSILHVTVDEKLQHYIIFFPSSVTRSSGTISVFDPAKGLKEMPGEELEKIWASKILLKLSPNKNFEKRKENRSRRTEWIIGLIKDDMRLLSISLFIGIVVSALGISNAVFTQKLIDDVLPHGDIQKLISGLVLLALLLLVRTALTYLRGFFIIKQGINFNNRILRKFYNHLLSLPKPFFDTRKTGDLIARMNDTRRIQSVVSIMAGAMAIDILLAATSVIMIFNYSFTIGFILLGIMPFYFVILFVFNAPIVNKQKDVMNSYSHAESNFIDTIQGITEIKLHGKQTFFENANAKIYGRFQEKIASLGTLNIKFTCISEIVSVMCLVAVFSVSSWFVIHQQLKLGELVAMLSITGNLLPSLNRLIIANIQIQEALVAFDRMFEFTSIKKEDVIVHHSSSSPEETYSVELHSVCFRFAGHKQILKNISLTVSTGQITALFGESGGGKSTVLQLIQNFYKPERGKILVNGSDLHELPVEVWRSRLGCVPQDVKIFNGSLLFNITLSDDKEEIQRAISFCEETGLASYFNELPKRYLTLVGEGGINLSGGQKQMVALARALYQKPPVLLLDEPTSAMDTKTESFVLQLLTRLKPTTAILMVTHRMQVAEHCDHIYFLEKGYTRAVTGAWHL